jgi:hypothetical protein
MYEVFTREHVVSLAAYVRSRKSRILNFERSRASGRLDPTNRTWSSEWERETHRPLRVLELGAGTGELHRGLVAATRALDEREGNFDFPSVTHHATDDYSSRLVSPRRVGRSGGVRKADAFDALADAAVCDGHPPDVVLVCWHPMRADWTAAIRAAASVAEYVLIGETDDGACGDPEATWGFREDEDDETEAEEAEEADGKTEEDETALYGSGRKCRREGTPEAEETVPPKKRSPPPFARDGFSRFDLHFLSRYQVGRTDEPWRKARLSKTVSFRRDWKPEQVRERPVSLTSDRF